MHTSKSIMITVLYDHIFYSYTINLSQKPKVKLVTMWFL